MTIARRELLIALRSALTCVSLGSLSSIAAAASAGARTRIALLAPLSGPNAGLGRSMVRAAALLQGKDKDKPLLIDTAGADGARGAAARALRQDAQLIVGPLFASDTRAVMAVVGTRVPVLSLSNDPELQGSGAFQLGITPSQSTSAILDYARSRGVQRIALAGPGSESPWARGVAVEARRLQGILGISVQDMPADPADSDLARLATLATGPDAVLIADGGPAALALARRLRTAGVQCLATLQLLDSRPEALAALDGAWISAPDPDAFQDFAHAYAVQGNDAGLVAALAHDGLAIARRLAQAQAADRAGLLALGHFAGATGNLRFRTDGSCVREMAILLAHPAAFETVDHRAAA
jgi:branched-chain amino acid transport system substrate-binding protein